MTGTAPQAKFLLPRDLEWPFPLTFTDRETFEEHRDLTPYQAYHTSTSTHLVESPTMSFLTVTHVTAHLTFHGHRI